MLAVFASAETVPNQLLEGLSSEEFKARETSQLELEKWVNEKGSTGVNAIFKVYQESDDPEVRTRCLRVLRTESDKDYLNDGKGYLGVQLWEEMLVLPGDERPRVCIKVTFIMPGSQAQIAGIKVGDVITAMDGKKWYEQGALTELIETVASYKPLRKVVFEIKRAGEDKLIEVPVILGKRPVENLGEMYYRDRNQLEKEARDKHFSQWLKKQNLSE
ncbi:MAG: PDZ domain-containing protein [Verrucomicrobiota bacterium]